MSLGAVSAGILAIAVAACGGPDRLPEPQASWPTMTATVDGRDLRLLVAQDHAIGMRGVADLGGLHGMLFAYDGPIDPSAIRFTMAGVEIDLDGHFFAADGTLIETIRMAACPTGPCRPYGPARPFQWVIEAPAASLAIADGARLVVGSAT